MMDVYQLICIATGIVTGFCIVDYRIDKRKSSKNRLWLSIWLFVVANGLNFVFAYLKNVKGWDL